MNSSANELRLGTPHSPSATRALLLGSGELGKEVCIELQRLGVEVIAVDRYENAPAMQVAHKSHVIDMLSETALRQIIELEQPHYIVPEIEAIATNLLIELEIEGFNVVPTARATKLTMDREGIRRLAAETLSIPTSAYHFASDYQHFCLSAEAIGYPCVVKPVMSSSGKGQSVLKSSSQLQSVWDYAQEGGRAGKGKVIVEGFVDFDYEITLLTVRAIDGVHFCDPIGHRQENGDYQESWQPQAMSAIALEKSQAIAEKIVNELGGYGLFGVELFICGDKVYFSEVSPRPHDTGMVTLISQELSEFALHARAILGLPIGEITRCTPSASAVILGRGKSCNIQFSNLNKALSMANGQIRLFGKNKIEGTRRLGVALSRSDTSESAVKNALAIANKVKIHY